MREDSYLEVKNLNVVFNKQPILVDINFDLKKGERVGIIGKNGAGKTTFLESLVGLTPLKSGIINIHQSIANAISSIFQEASFESYTNLKEIYEFFLSINFKNHNKNCDSVFQKYGIENCIKKPYHKLSGGQKQRFKILIALETAPKLLLLDEFNNSIDYESRQYFLNMIEQYLKQNPDCALIMVSHDQEELMKLTKTQYLLKDQKLELTDMVQKHA